MDATKVTTAADERTRRVGLYVREDCLGLRRSKIRSRERFVGHRQQGDLVERSRDRRCQII
jgi:hypothetical protein